MSSSWLSDKRYRRQASAFVTSTTTSTICLRIASRSSWLLIEAEIRCSTSTSRVFSRNACWRYGTEGVRVVVIDTFVHGLFAGQEVCPTDGHSTIASHGRAYSETRLRTPAVRSAE